MYHPSLSLMTFLVLKFILSEINIAIFAFFYLVLTRHIFLYSFLLIYMYLYIQDKFLADSLWASLWLSGKFRICLQCRRCGIDPLVGKIPWRRKWQPTPVCLPGKFHGQRNLVGYSLWGCSRVRHDLVTEQ